MTEINDSSYRENHINSIRDYLQNNCTEREDYLLGSEMEFFVVKEESGAAVTYFEENGIKDILRMLAEKGWSVCERNEEYILCLKKDEDEINLEPGGQFELSFAPRENLSRLVSAFFSVCEDIIPILNSLDYSLISLGYQPVTSIDSIPLLPKERYKHMYKHFKKRGKYAHNMMKATSSLQISLDYSSEDDFAKKFAAASWLIPIVYALFDNAPLFEGEEASSWAIRSQIWCNCDDDRCGLPEGVLDPDFSFADYAAYIVDMPAIFDPKNPGNYTHDLSFAEVLKTPDLSRDIIEHMLTMSFTDIRAKGYLEIRMADTLPYPYNFGYLSLITGLLYDEENLERLYNLARKTGLKSIFSAQDGIPHQGVNIKYTGGRDIADWGGELMNMASSALDFEARRYLDDLREFLQEYCPPRRAYRAGSGDGDVIETAEAIEYSSLNKILKGKL